MPSRDRAARSPWTQAFLGFGQILRIQLLQRSGDEASILADKLAVEPHLAAAVVRALNVDHVPVDAALVAIAADLVGLAGGEMEGTGDLLVEENVAHGVEDVGIEAEREFSDVP